MITFFDMPLPFVQFLAMAQDYVEALDSYWKERNLSDDELSKRLKQAAHDRMLRYEGWLIGFMDAHDVEWTHQEIAMRTVTAAFRVKADI